MDVRQLTSDDWQAVTSELRQTGAPAPAAAGAARTPPGRPVGFAPIFYPGTLSFADATAIPVGTGQEVTSIDLTARLVPTARIEGTVTCAGRTAAAGRAADDVPREPLDGLRHQHHDAAGRALRVTVRAARALHGLRACQSEPRGPRPSGRGDHRRAGHAQFPRGARRGAAATAASPATADATQPEQPLRRTVLRSGRREHHRRVHRRPGGHNGLWPRAVRGQPRDRARRGDSGPDLDDHRCADALPVRHRRARQRPSTAPSP